MDVDVGVVAVDDVGLDDGLVVEVEAVDDLGAALVLVGAAAVVAIDQALAAAGVAEVDGGAVGDERIVVAAAAEPVGGLVIGRGLAGDGAAGAIEALEGDQVADVVAALQALGGPRRRGGRDRGPRG